MGVRIHIFGSIFFNMNMFGSYMLLFFLTLLATSNYIQASKMLIEDIPADRESSLKSVPMTEAEIEDGQKSFIQNRNSCNYKVLVSCCCGECNTGAHVAIKFHMGQYYYAQAGTVSGKTHYRSADGKSAIWYTSGAWRISWKEDLGTTTNNAHIFSSVNCPGDIPNRVKFTWNFYNHDLSTFYDAGKS